MSTGLLALLDDVGALFKASAASLDDISTQVAKTSGKVSGIVIDDAAVTPKYVVGLDPSRELSIIYQIAKKSLLNKVFLLAPAALLLGNFAPWAIQPVLMLGGTYLCFEGYEKVHSLFVKHAEAHAVETITPEALEKMRVKSAVKTDFILSAEITAISYATVVTEDLMTQAVVMLCVAIGITVAVYGFVGFIVKADDIGLHMAKQGSHPLVKKLGRRIVKFMPLFMTMLSYIGTAAMLWVGAEIIAHGVPVLHHGLENVGQWFSDTPALAWVLKISLCVVGGLLLGIMVNILLRLLNRSLKFLH